MNEEIRKVWVISTAHMPEEVGATLYKTQKMPFPFIYNYAYGYGVYVRVNLHEKDEWLRPIILKSHKLEVDELRFDSDGLIDPDLPTYDW